MRATIKPLLGGPHMGILSILAQTDSYSDPTLYYTTTSVDTGVAAATLIAFSFFWFLFSIALYVFYAFFLMKIFKKAHVEAWAAWVPFYNTWKLLEIGGQQGFWSILTIIPFVNIAALVFIYIAMYNIGLKLDKDPVFVLLAIFLTPVWLVWLAIDQSKWDDTKGAPSLAQPVAPASKA